MSKDHITGRRDADTERANRSPSERATPNQRNVRLLDAAVQTEGSEGDEESSSDLETSSNRKTTASMELYDIEPALVENMKKQLKKRRNKVPPTKSSDDSFEYGQAYTTASRVDSEELQETYLLSDPNVETGSSVVSSLQLSSTESLSLDHDFGVGGYDAFVNLMQGNHNVESALAFIYMTIPPDGGYGWVILLLSFVSQLIVDGIVFSIGVLMPAISKEFQVSNSRVVLVASVQIGCYFTGGALSSAFINSYGFRPVCLFGVLLSALTILAASFAPNLGVLILCYSAIGGVTLSMIWVSSQLIIGYYFENYRPIASGISCAGAGAGMLIFSLTNSQLLVQLGWRNTMRVQVILVLLLFFVGLAFLEVAPTPVAIVHRHDSTYSSSDEYYGNFYVHNYLHENEKSRTSCLFERYEPIKSKSRTERCLKLCLPCCYRKKKSSETEPDMRDRRYVIRPDHIEQDDLFYTGPAEYIEHTPKNNQLEGKELELLGNDDNMQRASYRLRKIHEYDADENAHSADFGRIFNVSTVDPYQRRHNQHQEQQYKKKKKKKYWLRTKVVRAYRRLFDYHLFKIFEFRILVASAFLYPMGFNIPFVYSRVRTSIPIEYANMISPSIGLANIVVRIICGIIAYKKHKWTTFICGGGMIFGGFFVFISAFFGSDLIWFQILYGICYGVAPAVFSTLRALIYVRYLDLSRLTNAFGITALAMGLGVFIGTTFAGIMIEFTRGYTVAFAFAGICIIMAGSLKLVLPFIVGQRNSNARK